MKFTLTVVITMFDRWLKVIVGFFLVLGFVRNVSDAVGITSHIEITERASTYFNVVSQGIDYKAILAANPDALQAGAPYPDAFYSSLCAKGQYHDVSEDTHWTPFLNASVNYIRRHYQRPWDKATEKLVAFIFGAAQHQVADATWHSLDIDQGFLEAMAEVNYYGSFGDAHSDGDFGGDVMNLFALNMDYIGGIEKWYVPTDDLVKIYDELYGQEGRMPSEVIENCTQWLFLGRLGELIGVIELLYPRYAAASPFLLDTLQNYFLGGVDDMAAWSGNIWRETVTMLDYGTEVCNLDHNPIYVTCNVNGTQRHLADTVRDASTKTSRYRFAHNKFAAAVRRARKWIKPGDIIVRQTERGVVFEPSRRIQRLFKKLRTLQRMQRTATDTRNLFGLNTTMQTVYSTKHIYSRVGEKLWSGDVNNDGFDDLVISAPGYSSSGNYQQGRVYIIYGTAMGLTNSNITLESSADFVLEGPEPNGRFGASVVTLDVNKDGLVDLVVSAPSVGSDRLTYNGTVYVYLGQSRGRSRAKLSTQPNIVISCSERNCNFGWSLAAADINGDGFNDLIIGSPFAPSQGIQRGMVGVFYASPTTFQAGVALNEANFNWRWNGRQDYEWCGYSVNAKTLNSGQTWLVAGSPTYRICAEPDCSHSQSDVQSVGKVYVFNPRVPGQLVSEIVGTQQFSQKGTFVSVADINDGSYVIVSSIFADLRGSDGEPVGRGNVSQAGIVEFYRINGNEVHREPEVILSGDREFDRFGSSVQVFADPVDGLSNLIITAPFRSHDVFTDREAGRVYEFYDFGQSITAEQADMTYTLNADKSRFGSSIAIVHSDNRIQLVIGALHYTATRTLRLTGQVAVTDL